MSTYSYSTYQLERQRRREEWERAPKECPHCRRQGETTPINQRFSEYGNEKPRYHCGSDRCRKAASRRNIAERKRQARAAARARILEYCEHYLDREQKTVVMQACDLLMSYDYHHGHEMALQFVKVIEDKRCKHDRIAQLEQNAAIWKRRVLAARITEQQLNARIEELEAELEMFNSLEATIHGIATQQLRRQPDQEERQPAPVEAEQPDPDRARTFAILGHIGVKPYTGQEEDEYDREE